MSRAERLFDLLQILRRHRRPVSGAVLAGEAGISLRTLYRDVASLQARIGDVHGAPWPTAAASCMLGVRARLEART